MDDNDKLVQEAIKSAKIRFKEILDDMLLDIEDVPQLTHDKIAEIVMKYKNRL